MLRHGGLSARGSGGGGLRGRRADPPRELHRPVVVASALARGLARSGAEGGREKRYLVTMCGIVGWIATRESALVDAATVVRMRDSIVHRGPDGEGAWISPDRRGGLGFRPLPVLRLPAEAHPA